MSRRAFRSVLGVAAGFVFISAVVESLEFGLVTLINGGPTTDPVSYYAVRNRPWFLAAKLLYNTFAAVGAGYLVARIVGSAAQRHALALAFIQTAAFVWALTRPDLRQWTPAWLWCSLIILTAIGVMVGARMRQQRAAWRTA